MSKATYSAVVLNQLPFSCVCSQVINKLQIKHCFGYIPNTIAKYLLTLYDLVTFYYRI
jgi:hypothetical protein